MSNRETMHEVDVTKCLSTIYSCFWEGNPAGNTFTNRYCITACLTLPQNKTTRYVVGGEAGQEGSEVRRHTHHC